MKTALKVLAWIVGIPLTLMLIWFGINSFDAPLSPTARALLAPPHDPYPAEQNLYVAFAGFQAPSGQSVIAFGQARIARYNRIVAQRVANTFAASASIDRPASNRLTFQDTDTSDQWLINALHRWQAVRSHQAALAVLLTKNRELYQRYLALHSLHAYFETARRGSNEPQVWLAPRMLHMLFLAKVAQDIQSGPPARRRAALTEFQQDLQMWKTVLKGNGGLISKMLAAAWLHTDLLLGASMVTDPKFNLTLLGPDGAILTPFAVRDWRIGQAYDSELRMTAAIFRDTHAEADRALPIHPEQWWPWIGNAFGLHMFKLNATINQAALRAQHQRALADGDPATYSKRLKAYDSRKPRGRWHSFRNLLYNPVGHILLALGSADESFPARVYDVAAFQRLVYLAYQIRRQAIPFAKVEAFMRAHPQWSNSPLDSRAFRWNPATGHLAVVPGGHERERDIWGVTLLAPSPAQDRSAR